MDNCHCGVRGKDIADQIAKSASNINTLDRIIKNTQILTIKHG